MRAGETRSDQAWSMLMTPNVPGGQIHMTAFFLIKLIFLMTFSISDKAYPIPIAGRFTHTFMLCVRLR